MYKPQGSKQKKKIAAYSPEIMVIVFMIYSFPHSAQRLLQQQLTVPGVQQR